jgi:hypothetical protein
VNAHTHRLAAVALIAAAMLSAKAAEPPVTYLTPDTFKPAIGQTLTLRVNSGTPQRAEVAPWPEDQLRYFFVRGGGMQHNRPTLPATERDRNAAEFPISQHGVSVIALEPKPAVVQMSGEELKSLLLRNVAGAERDARVAALSEKATVRVRRVESATALVRAPEAAGEQAGPSSIAMSKLGLRVELRSLIDPTVSPAGSDWAVRAYIEGSNKSNVQVQATSLADGKTQTALTDRSGAARFHFGVGGSWRVEFHQAQPLENDSQADWVLYSGTLTFEVPTKGAGK